MGMLPGYGPVILIAIGLGLLITHWGFKLIGRHPGAFSCSLAGFIAVATALLAQQAAGTALSADSVRVSARLVAALPVPDDEDAWDAAAACAEAGDVVGCGRMMLVAHRLEDRSDILEWWRGRMPTNSLGN